MMFTLPFMSSEDVDATYSCELPLDGFQAVAAALLEILREDY